MDLESKGLNWWSAIYLRDIVIYFAIFIQMLIEYVLWPNKLFKWRQDLVFEQRFNSANEDFTEKRIIQNIQSIVEQIAEFDGDGQEAQDLRARKIEEQLPIEKEMSVSIKEKKSLAIDATIYSATYVSLIKSNKHKHKMT